MTRHGVVLVVDDNEFNRDALSRRLTHRGFDVSTANDGAAALRAIEEIAFDLILLDVEMPIMSGLDALRIIRQTRSRTDLPVIMVTARSEGADIVEAFTAGASDYVTKPIDFPVALARIDTHLTLKRATEALRRSEERYALAVAGANDALWDWDLAGDCVYWSPRWKEMLGLGQEEVGTSTREWLARIHRDDGERVEEALREHLSGTSSCFESEHRLLHRNGTYRWIRCRAAAVRTGGQATRVAGSFTDITDTKVADALTGLPNRLLFVELLERALRRTQRRPDCWCALLMIGFDRLHTIGDSLGSMAADTLIVAVARRLQLSLRATDVVTADDPTCTLARVSGGEFTVLVDDIRSRDAALSVASRLRATFEMPFTLDAGEVYLTPAIGVAVADTTHREPDDLLRDASAALHAAQADGSPGCHLFEPALRDGALSLLHGEASLRRALETDAFEMHYQPIVAIPSGLIASFEGLVRWRHPTRGVVSAAEFIPLAESAGLIAAIERSTAAQACRQMLAWRQNVEADVLSTICLNVSGRRLGHGDFVAEIAQLLADTGLPATALKIEITEGTFIHDLPAAQQIVRGLRTLGVRWSLDDFGTGYSSLSYLHGLAVDTVKIDRSFVARLGLDATGEEMIRAIVDLAHAHGMDIVAEGVETEDQLCLLAACGCDFAQGYYFSCPVDAHSATVLLADQPWRGIQVPARGVRHLAAH